MAIKIKNKKIKSRIVEDLNFPIDSSVLILAPLDRKDKSFPLDRINSSGVVVHVKEESFDKVKVVVVRFKDGEEDDFFPPELNLSLF